MPDNCLVANLFHMRTPACVSQMHGTAEGRGVTVCKEMSFRARGQRAQDCKFLSGAHLKNNLRSQQPACGAFSFRVKKNEIRRISLIKSQLTRKKYYKHRLFRTPSDNAYTAAAKDEKPKTRGEKCFVMKNDQFSRPRSVLL